MEECIIDLRIAVVVLWLRDKNSSRPAPPTIPGRHWVLAFTCPCSIRVIPPDPPPDGSRQPIDPHCPSGKVGQVAGNLPQHVIDGRAVVDAWRGQPGGRQRKLIGYVGSPGTCRHLALWVPQSSRLEHPCTTISGLRSCPTSSASQHPAIWAQPGKLLHAGLEALAR